MGGAVVEGAMGIEWCPYEIFGGSRFNYSRRADSVPEKPRNAVKSDRSRLLSSLARLINGRTGQVAVEPASVPVKK